MGRGRVIVFTSALDLGWSELPRSGFIVPFLQRLVRYLAAGSFQLSKENIIGNPVEISLKRREGKITCLRPNGERMALKPLLRGANFLIRIPEPAEKGIWRLFADEREIGIFSVNPDPRESDPSQLKPKEVKELIRGGETFLIPWKADLEEEVRKARYGRELWRTALWLVLGILAIEVLLGRQKG